MSFKDVKRIPKIVRINFSTKIGLKDIPRVPKVVKITFFRNNK